jgi:O-antigen/teichoic acid export membrane protein
VSQLKKGAILSYVKIALNIVLGLAITPFIIKKLGDSEYGLYTLIGSFVGYLTMMDLGLNNAIVRFIAKYQANGDKKGEENFLAVSFIIYAVIGILIAFGGWIMYLNIDSLFGETLTQLQLHKAKVMLLILIFNIAVTLPGGAFTGICTGYEKFVFPGLLQIFKYVVRACVVIAILNYKASAIGLVIIDTVMNLLFIGVSMYYVFKKIHVKIKLHHFEWNFIKEILGYSVWIFVFGLVYQFLWKTGQVVLGTNNSTVVVAIFGVGVMLGTYFTTYGNVINRLILPKAVQSVSKNFAPNVLTLQMIKVARITLIILFYLFGGFLLFGQDFILLWVGPVYKASWLVSLLIMIVYLLPISQGYAHAILEAKKLLRFKSLSFLMASIIGMVAGGILSNSYGVEGMIWGIFIPLFVQQWFIMSYFYHKKLQLNIMEFFKNLMPIILVFLIIISVCFFFFQGFTISWQNIVIKGLIYSTLFITIYFMIITKEEKQLILKRKI